MTNPDVIKAWARSTLNKLVEDAVDIQRVPEVKRDEVLTLIYALVDHCYHGKESVTTTALRKAVRANGGSVPLITHE